ncbi:MAG: hypothetical protein Kow00114_27040 [Kiloniellaceae bacterium]
MCYRAAFKGALCAMGFGQNRRKRPFRTARRARKLAAAGFLPPAPALALMGQEENRNRQVRPGRGVGACRLAPRTKGSGA